MRALRVPAPAARRAPAGRPARSRLTLGAALTLGLTACFGPNPRHHPTKPVWPDAIGPGGDVEEIVGHTWSQGVRFRPEAGTRVDLQVFPDVDGKEPSRMRVRSLWFAPARAGEQPTLLQMTDLGLLLPLRTTGLCKVGEEGLVIAFHAADTRSLDQKFTLAAEPAGVGEPAQGEAAAGGDGADGTSTDGVDGSDAGGAAEVGNAGRDGDDGGPRLVTPTGDPVPGTILLHYRLVPPSTHRDPDGHLRPFVPATLVEGRILNKLTEPGRAVAFNLRPFPGDAGERALVQFAETMDVWVLDLATGELVEPVIQDGVLLATGERLRPEDEPVNLQLSGPAFVHDELGYACPLWDYEAFFDAGGRGDPDRSRGWLLVDGDRDGRIDGAVAYDSTTPEFAESFGPEHFEEVLE